jgi:DNA polymerase-4
VRLLGVQASSFGQDAAQLDFLEDQGRKKWENVLSAADRLRDKFGESSITLGTGMKGGFRERTHENPAALPGKSKPRNA